MSTSSVDLARPAARARPKLPSLPRPRVGLRALSPLALLILWQAASSAGVLPERLLASPATVASTAITLTREGTLGEAAAISLQRAVIGFLIGAAAGLVLALLAGLSRLGESIVDPPMQMLRALPLFGLIPLFILWFGIGETPKVVLVAFGVFFPIYLNTYSGIRGVDAGLAEVGQVLRLGRTALIRHIVLPGALPQTLVGLRQSLGTAWLALIVAEQINASSGLGFMINDAREFLRIDIVVVGLLVYAILGLATDALVRLLERRALSWRRGLLGT
ncbi:sulfonate transport system permease protein [Actinomadura meyerae]|uniref:Sulfonate transport system permease protein n=1 Tax=Actinomadura meyerae TaxID=240840 RepID=A0A239F2B7_9ACTN|nr:ABC transporter permease [Actinomadura meyerae]SNS50688.1 sulfonate transport system permease protein [Actinomadura meyerae]